MAEQVNLDEVVTNIMYGLTNVIAEQTRLNDAKAVLYMALHNMQIYREETGLSTQIDNTSEWVRLFLASMLVRGCTEKTVETYKQEYKQFFTAVNKSLNEITTGDIRGYLAHCKLVRHNADQTINNKTRMLRGLFKWLTEEEYITKNPIIVKI